MVNQGSGRWNAVSSVAASGKPAERDGFARRQGRGRHRDRRDEQEREGILEAARQIEQRRELEDVVGEQQKGIVALKTLACRVADAQEDVEPCRERDHRQADAERQIEAQTNRRRRRSALAEHPEPAQADGGLQPQAALAAAEQVVHLGARRGLRRFDCVLALIGEA